MLRGCKKNYVPLDTFRDAVLTKIVRPAQALKACVLVRHFSCACCVVVLLFAAATTVCAQDDEVPVDYISKAHSLSSKAAPRGHVNGEEHSRFGLANIDSLPVWTKHFKTDGFDSSGKPQSTWRFSMVGNPPELGGTTTVDSPIIPVSLDLRDKNGNPRLVKGQRLFYDVTPFVLLTFASPVFQKANYASSPVATQFGDALQRAQFPEAARSDWHTLLTPSVKSTRVMTINQDPTCPQRCNYRYALNTDGTCCFFVLVDDAVFGNLLFPQTYPFDSSTPVGSAENSGDITTTSIATFLFPNTYLYSHANPSVCCTLGYHTFDLEPGTASSGNLDRVYVLNYSSWITPGIFDSGLADISALSHNVAEIFNNPFVSADGIHNVTPWWLSPNGKCQNDLEASAAIEDLPHQLFPITMNGLTYHPQNAALLQWFAFESPSSALNGAYSFPDAGTLQALSPRQNAGCKP